MKLLIAALLSLVFSIQLALADAPLIWGDNDKAQFLTNGWYFDPGLTSGKMYLDLVVDPSAGAGVVAPIGSVGVRNNAGVGEMWVKTAAANTAWTNVLTSLTGWSLAGNAGTTAGTNFIGTTDAIDLVLKANNTEYLRITSAGALDTTLGAGVLHSDASGILSSSAIVNADVATAAAIARSKLASGNANRLVVNDATGAMVDLAAITADRAIISNGDGMPVASAVTATELGYLGGLVPAAGGVLYTDADSILATAAGTAKQFLRSAGAGAPSFQDIPVQNTIWVDKSGDDANCVAGAINRPCLTVTQALSLVSAPATGNRYRIKVGVGTFTEATLALPPWTWITGSDGFLMGGPSRISVTSGAITITAAWVTGSQRGGLANIYLTGSTGFTADFAGLGASSSHVIEMFNVGMNGVLTMNANSGTLDFLDLYGVRCFGGFDLSGGSLSLVNSQILSTISLDNGGSQNVEVDL
jgi:hypothetical protein